MPIASPNGGTLPLDEVADLRLEPVVTSIERHQGERVNVVQGFLVPFALPAAALGQFQQALAASGFDVPAGYRLELGGEQEKRQESQGNLFSTVFTFLAAMILVVVLSLNSFREALLIALTGFLSIGLALFGVRLLGYPFGFMALIGTVGLVGLAINGSIIVLSALKANPQARLGNLDAGIDVVTDATRHIVATTATTVGGFIPLILFGGTFWPPLAAAIAGGVAGSALIALYTIPALYLTLRRRAQTASAPADVAETGAFPARIAHSGRAS
jgi:multidrug efflux pump subunit AcrB